MFKHFKSLFNEKQIWQKLFSKRWKKLNKTKKQKSQTGISNGHGNKILGRHTQPVTLIIQVTAGLNWIIYTGEKHRSEMFGVPRHICQRYFVSVASSVRNDPPRKRDFASVNSAASIPTFRSALSSARARAADGKEKQASWRNDYKIWRSFFRLFASVSHFMYISIKEHKKIFKDK